MCLMPGCGTTTPPAKAPLAQMPPSTLESTNKYTPDMVTGGPVFHPPMPVENVPVVAESKVYVVKAGDSLGKIAHQHGTTIAALKAANGLTSDKVRIGQKLQISGYAGDVVPKAAAGKHKTAKAKAAGASSGAGGYVVKSGDSLGKIAHHHGTTIAALKAANNLSSDTIRIGQKLTIPAGKVAKKAAPATGAAAGTAAASATVPTPAAETAVGVPPATPELPGTEPPASGAIGPDKGGMMQHIVDSNQPLDEIAMMYNISLDDLMKLNGLTNAAVKPGTVLKIPAAGL